MLSTCFLIFFSLLALASAIAVLVFKHPMRAALSLITSMMSLACIYALIGAHVIAVFQVLIYVGAVMVFMLYVIMLLDSKDVLLSSKYTKMVVPAMVVCVTFVVGIAVINPKIPELQIFDNQMTMTFKTFSESFVRDHFIHFELTSVLLLVSVVAVTAILKGKKYE